MMLKTILGVNKIKSILSQSLHYCEGSPVHGQDYKADIDQVAAGDTPGIQPEWDASSHQAQGKPVQGTFNLKKPQWKGGACHAQIRELKNIPELDLASQGTA